MPDAKMFCLECVYSNCVTIRKFYRFRFIAFLAGLSFRKDEDGRFNLFSPYLLSCALLDPDGEVIRFFFERELSDNLEGGDDE